MTAPSRVVVLSPDELGQLVRDAVADVLADHEPAEPAPVLVDRAGLARALGVSAATVDRMRREGCPELRVGEVPRFEIGAVIEWLRERDAHAEAAE